MSPSHHFPYDWNLTCSCSFPILTKALWAETFILLLSPQMLDHLLSVSSLFCFCFRCSEFELFWTSLSFFQDYWFNFQRCMVGFEFRLLDYWSDNCTVALLPYLALETMVSTSHLATHIVKWPASAKRFTEIPTCRLGYKSTYLNF